MAFERSKSQKGKEKAYFEGYGYNYKRVLASGEESWECDQRRNTKCRGRLVTFGDNARQEGEHIHAPDPVTNSIKKIRVSVKEAASTTRDNPGVIVRDATAGVSEPVAANLPSRHTMSKVVRYARKGIDGHRLPANLDEFWVPEDMQISITGAEFLVWDSWPEQSRILIFATEQSLKLLSESKMWHLDGTFKTAPLLFHQLYTFHGYLRGKSFPLVYCLLPNKTQITYSKVLDKLKMLCPRLDPDAILVDFERAVINAIQHSFPRAEIRGCTFHFQQCLWRKIQGLPDICRRYKQEAGYASQVKRLGALAFRKIEDVRPSYEMLIATDFFQQPEIRDLLDYFESTWVGIPPADGFGRWTESRFPVIMWNVFESVGNGFARTNNGVEGWHFRFQSLLSCCHPNIYKFVEELRKEEDSVRIEIARLQAGARISPRKKKYVEIDQRLQRICDEYDETPVLDFLGRVSHVIAM